MFFEAERQNFFRPLNGKRRELVAACVRSLYERLHGPGADYSQNLNRDNLRDVLIPAIQEHSNEIVAYERNPRIEILDEVAIRTAVGRQTRIKAPNELWREAVAAHLVADEAIKEVVSRYRIEIPGRTAEQLVRQLGQLPSLRDEPLLLREVSARLFWGNPKCWMVGNRWWQHYWGLRNARFPRCLYSCKFFCRRQDLTVSCLLRTRRPLSRPLETQAGDMQGSP